MENEDWKAHKEELKLKKVERQKTATEIILHLGGEYDFKVEIIAPYQIRMFLLTGTFDYFPQSKKMTELGSGVFKKCHDIEKYINDLYPF